MKNLLHQITLLFLILLLGACASGKKVVKEPSPSEAEAAAIDESFDPLTLNDEDIAFPEPPSQKAKTPVSGQTPSPSAPQATAGKLENRLVDGFRVQLFATKDIESATIAKKEAEFAFAEDSVNIYIEFDSPYYKLRIGDCTTREAAEKLREIARSKGYPSAWIVRTKVWSNPPLPGFQAPDNLEGKPGKG